VSYLYVLSLGRRCSPEDHVRVSEFEKLVERDADGEAIAKHLRASVLEHHDISPFRPSIDESVHHPPNPMRLG
jgi:hypothetical protein